LRHMLTAVLTLCDHLSGGPSGVPAQSLVRIRAPISPPRSTTISVRRANRPKRLGLPLQIGPRRVSRANRFEGLA
jgi:hypothetical protein